MLKQEIIQGRYDKVIRDVVGYTKKGWEINKSPSSIQLLGAGIIRVYVEVETESPIEDKPTKKTTPKRKTTEKSETTDK